MTGWAHALQVGLLLLFAGCLAFVGTKPRPRNRMRDDVLPPPSEKCLRGFVEAPGRFE